MKILVLGGDSRANTLIWKLFNSPGATDVVCAPGNAGTGQLVPNAPLDLTDPAAITRWVFDEGFDLVLPAQSDLLYNGLSDEIVGLHLSVFGPPQRAAALEQSRCLAKEFLLRHQLPTAPGRAFTNLEYAERYLATQTLPVMIKADHPSGGEAIFSERYAALAGLRELFTARPLQASSTGVVIESELRGPRVALTALTDGTYIIPFPVVRLYDHVGENDTGAQIIGIGAFSSTSTPAQRITEYMHQHLLTKLVKALATDGIAYWGFLGIDAIITNEGPRITALRCVPRLGELEVVLPRLEDDLLPLLRATIARRLHELPLPRWSALSTVGMGLYARGYPHSFASGGSISGQDTLDEGALLFHHMTESSNAMRYTPRIGGMGSASTTGGLFGTLFGSQQKPTIRVTGGQPLFLVTHGVTLASARGRALVNAERLNFEGRTFRSDIGASEFV
jgi:phosphoribosylamine--glycine ligase